MNLSQLLAQHEANQGPVRIVLIGAGKFGSMVLAQARFIPGLHVAAVVDLDGDKVRAAMERVGWPPEQSTAATPGEAISKGTTCISKNLGEVLSYDEIDCVVEATGNPIAGVRHALQAIDAGRHIVMVNVEADVLCGPLLARRAAQKGVVYSMAYGDQPAIICELVDWVRATGFELVSAGKGMNFEPRYRYSTPDTVWKYFGWSDEEVARGDFNPKMYNSFTDGTKAAIEMAAVANSTGLDCPDDGLAFYPSGIHDLPSVFKPEGAGGRLGRPGLLDIAASQERDGREVFNNIRFGVFVTFKAPTDYARDCFKQYGLTTDRSGWYGAMWRPFHLIGLETSISVLSAVLRSEATGVPKEFRADAVATAKRDLQPGDVLDGEGGYTVWAKAIPATASVQLRGLPIGLAQGAKVKRPVAKDAVVSWNDVEVLGEMDIASLRMHMEAGARTRVTGHNAD